MAIELVFETHSTTVDNEQGRATGWLPGQLSGQGRLQAMQLGRRRRGGVPLEDLMDQNFTWQEGWEYRIS